MPRTTYLTNGDVADLELVAVDHPLYPAVIDALDTEHAGAPIGTATPAVAALAAALDVDPFYVLVIGCAGLERRLEAR